MTGYTVNVPAAAGAVLSGSFTVQDVLATRGLPFVLDLPTLRKSPRRLFAHYFGPFPISIDNAQPDADYYERNYLRMGGESGSRAAYGGYIRNRPKGRPTISGDYVSADAITDIQQAAAAGVDGFFCDIMSSSGKTWTFYTSAFAAAGKQFPGGEFKVVPMIDVSSGTAIRNYSTDQVADAIAAFSKGPATWVLADGRMVVSSFDAEAQPLSWWQAVFASLASRYGVNAAFLPAYLDITAAARYAGQPWTYGSGFWGDGADPQIQALAGNKGTAVHNRGEKYLFPVQGQSVRVLASKFDEAHGTAALRGAWARAISDQADVVQYVTWNDYSEGGEFNDSVARGLCQLNISAFYAFWWKTGAAPEIVRDVVYIANRNQLTTAKPTGGQTAFLAQWQRPNREPVQDLVEVLTFLTAPAQVRITVGGVTTTVQAPAGVTAQYVPLAVGAAPSAVVVRDGQQVAAVTSPAAVLAAPLKDDRQYFQASSEDGTAGQFDPQTHPKYGL